MIEFDNVYAQYFQYVLGCIGSLIVMCCTTLKLLRIKSDTTSKGKNRHGGSAIG